jgi:hypothetical protein
MSQLDFMEVRRIAVRDCVIDHPGHYERKLKHLNKQKEGKKRLKMLAGNIEVPQSAFFDVLSSRPRNFSTSSRSQALSETIQLPREHYEPSMPIGGAGKTSARRSKSVRARQTSTLASDPLASEFEDPNLPSLRPMKLSTRPHQPMRPSAVSPIERSKRISELLQASTCPSREVGFLDVYSAYVKAFYSSASGDQLTEDEILTAMNQMHEIQFDVKRGLDRDEATSKMRELSEHLRALGGDEALEMIDSIMLSVIPRGLSQVSAHDIDMAERRIQRITSSLDSGKLEKMRGPIQFFLHLLATSRFDEGRFERYWDQLVLDKGLRVSTSMRIARLKFLDRVERRDEIVPMVQSAIDDPSTEHRTRLLNAAMVCFADMGRWDVVADIYGSLGRVSAPFPLDSPLSVLRIPGDVRSDRRTYTEIIPLLAFSGYVETALSVLNDMVSAGHTPFIREYMAIISGFASFGEPSGPTPAHTVPTDLFPEIEVYRIGRTRTSQRLENEAKYNDAINPFAKIWEKGAYAPIGQDVRSPTSPSQVSMAGERSVSDRNGQSEPTGWTRETLEFLFRGCMAVRPGGRGVDSPHVAPRAETAWNVLMAFSRVSRGDTDVVRAAWEAMDAKFSGKTGEKWVEWRMNSRLERVVGVLMAE